MVAFSGCVYDGGKTEKVEMDSAREKGWGDKFKLKDRISKPGLNRKEGRCPMTPLEVTKYDRMLGIMLHLITNLIFTSWNLFLVN